MSELRAWYSLLRRGLIGRFGDAYIIAMIFDGIWPGVLDQINAHIILFAAGTVVISMLENGLRKLTRPEPQPCESVEPELDFKDEDK